MFLREVLTALALRRVRYCVVGGVAVNLHGIPRMTYDLDLVVIPEREELSALLDVLTDLGLRCQIDLDLRDFADAEFAERIRRERNLIAVCFSDPDDPLREVDVLVSPPIDARTLVSRAIDLDLAGTRVPVASIQDMIALKRASPRAHDLADLAHLERILAEPRDG